MKTIRPFSRVLLFLCAVVMVWSLNFPVWQIILEAPQYPEGLKMEIWSHKIAGDVDKINGLNHYIGMGVILDENFPELKIIPYCVVIMGVLGLLVAATGKRWVLLCFVIYQISFGIWGMYRFWYWEYEYGHNLDPHAAIKIPGMSYQPPLLGWKELLNFLAGSFPDIGGLMVIIPSVILVLVWGYEQFLRKN